MTGPAALAILVWLADPVPDLGTIRAHYVGAVTLMHSLDCKYTVEREYIASFKKDFGENLIAKSEVQMYQSGSRFAYTSDGCNPKGEPNYRTWHGYDGKAFAHWEELLLPLSRRTWLPTGVIKTERDVQVYSTDGIERLMGEGLYGGLAHLREILNDDNQPHVVGWEKVNGHRCVKVHIPDHVAAKTNAVRAWSTVWFDPEQRFLPRRIDTEPKFDPPPKNSSLVTYETHEFARIAGDDGETHLFPKRGVYKSAILDSLVTLTEVRINGPVDEEHFAPKFPDLTEVRQQLPNGQELTYVVGDAKKRAELEEIMIKRRTVPNTETKAGSTPSSPTKPAAKTPPSAKPKDQSSLPAWMLRSAGLVICGVAIAVWIRSRQT